MSDRILLGFEAAVYDDKGVLRNPDTVGKPVYLPLHHLAIFGMTQLSGKTTTLEGLISRSGLKAIAFITKRGEAGFTAYNLITPYYKPRADWQFVEGLVNVALGEKVKYEPGMRWAIMKVCRGRHDLREIQKAAQDLAKESKREFMKSVFEKLAAYLEIVVPELEKWVFSDRLKLEEGVNVMDLSGMRLETQHLVIASTIEYTFANLDHVIVIIPEAWESIPQSKMTPVKWVAQQFIRKGAAIGNYMFLDSQDIGGIDKTPLRQCDNWLMGRMKEAHEVERILKQLLGMKVAAEEIQTLALGHFYAAIGNEVKKVYILPVGVPEAIGKEVALGKRSPESVRDEFLKPKVMEVTDMVWKEKFEEEQRKRIEAENELLILKKKQETFEVFKKQVEEKDNLEKRVKFLEAKSEDLMKRVNEAQEDLKLFEDFKSVLRRMFPQPAGPLGIDLPSEVVVQREVPALIVKTLRKQLVLNTDNAQGRSALLYAEGFFDEEERSIGAVQKEMIRRGWPKDPRLSGFLDELCSWGYLRKRRTDRWLYRAAMKSTEAREKGLLKEVEAQ